MNFSDSLITAKFTPVEQGFITCCVEIFISDVFDESRNKETLLHKHFSRYFNFTVYQTDCETGKFSCKNKVLFQDLFSLTFFKKFLISNWKRIVHSKIYF